MCIRDSRRRVLIGLGHSQREHAVGKFDALDRGLRNRRTGDPVSYTHLDVYKRQGLVGRSGSGKTTLTKLLLRLSDVQDGHVRVDGQDR